MLSISLVIRYHESQPVSQLLGCIDSVISVNYEFDEIIILQTNADIQSEVLEQFGSSIVGRITFLTLSSLTDNRAAALVRGIRSSKSTYIIFLDSDDFLNSFPDFDLLEKMLPFDFLSFSYIEAYYDEISKFRFFRNFFKKKPPSSLSSLLNANAYPLGSFLIKREFISSLCLPEGMVYLEDYYLLLKFYLSSKKIINKYIDIPVFIYSKSYSEMTDVKYNHAAEASQAIIDSLKAKAAQ